MKGINYNFAVLLIAVLTLSGCKKAAKITIKQAAEVERLVVETSPALKNRLSALPVGTQDLLGKILKENPRVLAFLNESPDFIYNWNYLHKSLPNKSLDPIFLRSLRHVDDYAKYGGNKLQNYIFKEQGGNVLVYGKNSEYLLATIKPGQIVEIPINNANNWFTQLKPLANSRYIIGRAKYETDEMGRVVRSEFPIDKLSLKQSSVRDGNVQKNMHHLKSSQGNDHAGHLLGDQFGGSSNMVNLVPQSQKVNSSLYKRHEMKWKQLALGGDHTNVSVECIYEGLSERPSWIKLKYKVNGEDIIEMIKN